MVWVSLPFRDERLESVIHDGNGKDAELQLVFADGRRAVLPTSAVRIEVDGGVVIEVSSLDDVSLSIKYRAPDLSFRSGRIGFPAEDDDELVTRFRTEVESWLADGCGGELRWTMEVQISLGGSVYE